MKLFLRYLLGLQQIYNSPSCRNPKTVQHMHRNETLATAAHQKKGGRVPISRRDCHPVILSQLSDAMFLKGVRAFPEIFMLQADNTKRPLPDWDTYQSVIGSNATIFNIYPEILDLFPTGRPWPSISQQ